MVSETNVVAPGSVLKQEKTKNNKWKKCNYHLAYDLDMKIKNLHIYVCNFYTKKELGYYKFLS